MLDKINSIINGNRNALDKDKAFTFIEFIKCFGFDNNPDSFFVLYKEYLNKWADVKAVTEISKTKDEYVREKIIDTLKSITLNYCSYEEQDFIAHIDWSNETLVAALIPLYVRKIMQICEFYRKKRNDAPLIVKKHNTKGSTKSIEQIVYDKIVDFVFENRNLIPQYATIRHDLYVSVEAFVDTYSEYFDIPRNPDLSDASRADVLAANMNDVDYRDYLQIADVISDIIYSGEMYLKEIPLIASVGLNLSDECAGDLLDVKNQLLSNALINLVPLTEQVDLKRKLYEKFLGCDLYYIYADANLDTYTDILCRASNPSGNLLNCGTADTATTEADSFELLSRIGLYFKPDKCGVLKVDARNYKWEIDRNALTPETVYVFPDPNRYGDIGTNKSADYPLLMEFDLNYDIKNFSSGESRNDPIVLMGHPGWRSYYSKQDEIFEVNDNKDYTYAFTNLANVGCIHSYQKDVYGNEFALMKGVKMSKSPSDGSITVIVNDKIGYGQLEYLEEKDNPLKESETHHVHLNGGYFSDPTSSFIKPFNFNRYNYFDEHYKWTSIIPAKKNIIVPGPLSVYVKCGKFSNVHNVKYKDNYGRTSKSMVDIGDKEDFINNVIDILFTAEVDEKEVKVEKVHKTADEIDAESGVLYMRDSSSLKNKPCSLLDLLKWLKYDELGIWDSEIQARDIDLVNDVKSFDIIKNNIVVETSNAIIYIQYDYNGASFYRNETIQKPIVIDKNAAFATSRLFDESTGFQYVLQLYDFEIGGSKYLFPFIYEINPSAYTVREAINLFDIMIEEVYNENTNDVRLELQKKYHEKTAGKLWDEKVQAVEDFLAENGDAFKAAYLGSEYNLENFIYEDCDIDPESVAFTKNNALNRYLIAYMGYDKTEFPSLFEHKFKILNNSVLNDTIVSNVYSVAGASENRTVLSSSGGLENFDSFFIRLK